MLYIRLFHGRTDPKQDMDDWGSDGPVLGPYKFAHTTYQCHLKLGKPDGGCDELYIVGPDMVFYDGMYYGDWSVFGDAEFEQDNFELSAYDQSKAKPPKFEKRQAKIIVYIKGGVCQDYCCLSKATGNNRKRNHPYTSVCCFYLQIIYFKSN